VTCEGQCNRGLRSFQVRIPRGCPDLLLERLTLAISPALHKRGLSRAVGLLRILFPFGSRAVSARALDPVYVNEESAWLLNL